MTEQQIQHKIIKYLEKCGYYVVKVVSANKNGVPDLLVCVDGLFVAFEVKTKDGVISKLQNYNLQAINKAKGFACVVYDVVDVMSLLGKLKR